MRRGEKPNQFLPDISDESIIQLLMGADETRKVEKDILATAAFNRMRDARRRLDHLTREALHVAGRLETAVQDVRPKVHGAEEMLYQVAEDRAPPTKREMQETAREASHGIERIGRVIDEANRAAHTLRAFQQTSLESSRREPEG